MQLYELQMINDIAELHKSFQFVITSRTAFDTFTSKKVLQGCGCCSHGKFSFSTTNATRTFLQLPQLMITLYTFLFFIINFFNKRDYISGWTI